MPPEPRSASTRQRPSRTAPGASSGASPARDAALPPSPEVASAIALTRPAAARRARSRRRSGRAARRGRPRRAWRAPPSGADRRAGAARRRGGGTARAHSTRARREREPEPARLRRTRGGAPRPRARRPSGREQLAEPQRVGGAARLVLVLEEHERRVPALRAHGVRPARERGVVVVGPPEPEVAERRRRGDGGGALLVVGDAERGARVGERREHLVVVPAR